jgi:RNA polymerase sigma factor (sigma-70 family)
MNTAPLPIAQTLLTQARAGDRDALERLLRHCQSDLRRYARRHCHSDDIDEAVQDALWILSRRLTALRVISALSSWLFQVVRRACLRLRSQQPDHVELDDSHAELQQDDRASTELRIDLARGLAALPEHYRSVLVLIDLQGCSGDEAAAELGITVEAAKSRLHRARMMLREGLSAA